MIKEFLLIARLLLAAIVLVNAQPVCAQDDLMNLLDSTDKAADKNKTDYTYATFKTTKIISGESVEIPGPGVLKFDIDHRFGTFQDGWRGLFGLDQANIYFGIDYGINPWLAVGFGRSSADGMYEGYAKAKVLRQSTGHKKFPLTIDLYTDMGITSVAYTNPDQHNYVTSRFSYAYSVLIARKFNRIFSMQLSPTLVHMNLVPTSKDHNDVYSIGVGGRIMVSRNLSINGEYFYLIPGQVVSTPAYSMASIGIDIETGGHVFQFMVTNARGMVPDFFVPTTDQQWRTGAVRLGFNIDRVFTLYNYEKAQKKMAMKRERKKELKKQKVSAP